MPLGISYYSFKIISYIVEVYKGNVMVERSFIIFWNYIAFFPHMLCGPIERPKRMLEYLGSGLRYNKELFLKGVTLIIYGLFKKCVIADRIVAYVDTIFYESESFPGLALWIAAILFSIQLYCDFSGYSDVAVGITNLFGIPCEYNFKRPYFSESIVEFWKRWHISLSSWLRDYIYIPLGGSRTTSVGRMRNVMVTFLVCGIWHGNQMHYWVWGIYHGLFNILFFGRKAKRKGFIKGINILLTFYIAMIGWIFFKSENVFSAIKYISYMFTRLSFNYNAIVESILPFTNDNKCVGYFLTLWLMILLLFIREFKDEKNEIEGKTQAFLVERDVIWSGVFMVLIILFGLFGKQSFLYAGF